MAENSAIEWTHHTFNGWRGCSKVHAGCTNCYAEVNYSVKMHGVKWGPDGTRVKLSDAGWKEPLKWNRDAQAAGERRRVFCASLADVFEDWQGPILNHNGYRLIACRDCGRMTAPDPCEVCPQCGRRDFLWLTMADLRRDLFELIDETPMLDWLLLTKRPENIKPMWRFKYDQSAAKRLAQADVDVHPYYRENVWLGTSISDQKTADEWIPRLLENRRLCPVLFLSCEPLLGPIALDPSWLLGITNIPAAESMNPDVPKWAAVTGMSGLPSLDWVIVGGESGSKARPCNVNWIRSIVEQCKAAGVPCFVKQLGAHVVVTDDGKPWGGTSPAHLTVQGRVFIDDPKGGNQAEWEAGLRIRQFPELAKV